MDSTVSSITAVFAKMATLKSTIDFTREAHAFSTLSSSPHNSTHAPAPDHHAAEEQVNFHSSKIAEQQDVFEAEINAKDGRLAVLERVEDSLATRIAAAYEPMASEIDVFSTVVPAVRQEVDDTSGGFLLRSAEVLEDVGGQVDAVREASEALLGSMHD
eukprot:CAMPEP_0118877908 /NCGR_PEP_ID=MMETSP1163-20130328/18032_1 /TAXON_ID=124430 /ORGANISM="Phaeomonas parva, Strain CCMP2877" /LENGTH=158 /DNA_ID=CAMNT_0006813679 /DNA_START=51 /DNA_END=524 /DNA_ORIENTATION=-